MLRAAFEESAKLVSIMFACWVIYVFAATVLAP